MVRLLPLLLLLSPQTDPVRDLVDRLRSEHPGEREQAFRKIQDLGRAAAPQLALAATGRDPELAERSRLLLRTLEIRESLPAPLLREVPRLEQRLALGPSEWTRALLEASPFTEEGRQKHPSLRRKDLDALAGEAVRRIRILADPSDLH